MAVLDLERNVVVIRIVYDGPPEAGKTTSLRALAGSLGKPLYCPEEHDGRTLFFDWMDYTAGRFEGKQIRCQLVSVPGQRKFLERRTRLLREADAVIFVADSRRAELETTMSFLRELPELMKDVPAPPVGIVVQANKRDLPDAVPLPELRTRLDEAGCRMGVMESIAADGPGIRETFIFGVRLALDRVRELMRLNGLARGKPELDSGEALLDWMKANEGAARQGALAAPAIEQVLAENSVDAHLAAFAPWRAPSIADLGHAGSGERGPRPPDPTAPSGAIWPPVDGRLILHEAAATGLTTHRLRNGDWAAGIGSGWRAYTRGNAVFADVEHGRASLVKWARLHAACHGLLSSRRCVVLADAGDGSWRLWQIVRSESSLRDDLEDLDKRSPEDAAGRLLDAAELLLEMDGKLARGSCQVPCTLDTVGRGDHGPMYIGLMPNDASADAPPPRGLEIVPAELGPLLCNTTTGRRLEVLTALRRSRRHSFGPRGGDPIRQSVTELLSVGVEPDRTRRRAP